MQDPSLFYEKQYLGRNQQMLIVRLILAACCFAAWYFANKGELFLLLGIGILFFSSILTFAIHFKTRVINNSIELEQFWSLRKVKIPLKNIRSIAVEPYERFRINNPVFNIHLKGTIHFYTRGEKAVMITDKDGTVYCVGSQQPERLAELVTEEKAKLKQL